MKNFFKKLYFNFVLRVKGELVISYFVVFHFLFPICNCIRAALMAPFTLNFILFFCFLVSFFYLIFKSFADFYLKTVKFLFNNSLPKLRLLLSLGPLFLKEYPKFFRLYVCLSISFFYLVKTYPEIFWIFIVHFIFLVFRNFCILPITGYSLIIKLNQEILRVSQDACNSENKIPLFKKLEKDNFFKSQFSFWCNWIEIIKPNLQSIQFLTKITVPNTIYWNGFFILGVSGIQISYYLNTQKNKIYKILEYIEKQSKSEKDDKTKMILEILQGIKQKITNLNQNYSEYQDMDSFSLVIHYLFGDKKLLQFIDELHKLNLDCIHLEYFTDLYYLNSIQTSDNLNDLLILLEKYAPESLQKNDKFFVEIDLLSKNIIIHTCLEKIIQISSF